VSALTKTFVVLLVVMSLLSAAGFVVFVNQVENFRTSLASVNATLSQSKSDLAAAKAQTTLVQTQLASAMKDADDAQKENTRLANDDAAKIAALEATVASDKSSATIAAVSLDNVTAALTASEAQRKSLGDALASARTDLDSANKKLSDSDLAISDLTNKLDVADRKVTDFSEQLAEAKGENDRLTANVKELGGNPGDVPDRISSSAPAINAVVRDTRPINGIPYATISVGSAEQVQKGMVFHIVDREHAHFLGDLVIDSVDLHEATGKLEGPAIGDVRVGTDARTQL
jgi:peptidoglycan hydrolase CwlO-like protein